MKTGDSDDAAQSNSNAETAPNVETESSSEAEDASQTSTESNFLDSYFAVNDSEDILWVKDIRRHGSLMMKMVSFRRSLGALRW